MAQSEWGATVIFFQECKYESMANQNDCKISRRKFLQGLMAAPLVVGVKEDAPRELSESKVAGRVSMLQTWADAKGALVVALGEPGWSFSTAAPERVTVKLVRMDQLSGSGLVLYRLQVEGLSTSSYDELVVRNQSGQFVDRRRLKGLDLDMSSPKIAALSCANYRKLETQARMYSRLQEQAPDLNLFTGDIVYSNSRVSSVFGTPEDPGTALGRYIETWTKLDFYRMDPLIPCLAVWDDHDYGTNNGDTTHPHKAAMQRIFRSFYALPERHERLSFGPGLAFRLRAFGIDLHMLDGRSELEKKRSQWGAFQEAWFAHDYATSPHPAWILNGTQFFKYFPLSESVEKTANPSLQRLYRILRATKKPTIFISGDVHSSQVQELSESHFGYKTYEITSSAVHSSSAGNTMKRRREDGQLFYFGQENFILLQPILAPQVMDLQLSCATATGVFPISTTPLRIRAA